MIDINSPDPIIREASKQVLQTLSTTAKALDLESQGLQLDCPNHPKAKTYVYRTPKGWPKWRCTACNVERVQKTRRDNKARLVALMGGKCQCCGYAAYLGGLDFHHVDPATKSFSISGTGSTRSYVKMVHEAKKCVLVCCRCHREIEAGLRPCPESPLKGHLGIEPSLAS